MKTLTKEEILSNKIDNHKCGYNYSNIEATEGTMNDLLNIALDAMEEYKNQPEEIKFPIPTIQFSKEVCNYIRTTHAHVSPDLYLVAGQWVRLIEEESKPVITDEEIKQCFKELDIYVDDIYDYYINHKGKDSGNLWVQFSDKFSAFKKQTLAALNTYSIDKWISIDDKTNKLPDGDFLVLFDNGEIKRYFEEEHPFALYTHWQPLPKPPIKQ
jgi:hypothetical protein